MIQLFKKLALLAVVFLALFAVAPVDATERYAAATGAECGFCHLDPLGGGQLTASGQGYRLSLSPGTRPEQAAGPGVMARVAILLTGYLHILTGFMWFGTILYVHLVLKPAYASQGLPRGEVKVGLVSMAIMAVTGTVLTVDKVPDPGLLLSSRFGLLLLAKIVIFTVMVLSALYVVLVIGPKLRKKKAAPTPVAGEFTPAQLAGFDGEEGRPAYLAYQGMVYDVSGSRLWKNGSHMKRHRAGEDLSAILAQAPHGEEKILAMPLVGRLASQAATAPVAAPARVFYFMAYMNLGLVLLISLILALWRWL